MGQLSFINSMERVNTMQQDAKLVYMPDKDYFSYDAINASSIKNFLKHPQFMYQQDYIDKFHKKKKEELIYGSCLHTTLLEPDLFSERFIPINLDRRTKVGKQQYNEIISNPENENKSIIPQESVDEIRFFREKAKIFDIFKHIRSAFSKKEHTILWQDNDTGLLLKSKIDCFISPFVIDVKTCFHKIDSWNFSKAIYDYGYHISAAFYLDAINTLYGETFSKFIIFAFQKSDPWNVAEYTVDADALHVGRQEYKRGLREIKRYKDNEKLWQEPVSIGLPQYVMNQMEL